MKKIIPIKGLSDGGVATTYGFGLDTFNEMKKRGEGVRLLQFKEIVVPLLIEVLHIFQGLRRPLLLHTDMNGDKEKFVHTFVPIVDFERDIRNGVTVKRFPQKGRVFAVIIGKSSDSMVSGTIEHWGWVEEANDLRGAPVNWDNRFDRKVWSLT